MYWVPLMHPDRVRPAGRCADNELSLWGRFRAGGPQHGRFAPWALEADTSAKKKTSCRPRAGLHFVGPACLKIALAVYDGELPCTDKGWLVGRVRPGATRRLEEYGFSPKSERQRGVICTEKLLAWRLGFGQRTGDHPVFSARALGNTSYQHLGQKGPRPSFCRRGRVRFGLTLTEGNTRFAEQAESS